MRGGGPANLVTSLAFSPDGNTLYAGGWDQVVWVWSKNRAGNFELDPASTFRVPIGPGISGTINAISISPDGKWLAIAGKGVFRGQSGFDDYGKILATASLTTEMRLDQGAIHVFNTRTRESFVLRGHLGDVVALQFSDRGKPVLASVGRDWHSAKGKYVGALRLWDIEGRRRMKPSLALPEPTQAMSMVVRRSGSGLDAVSISIATPDPSASNKRLFRLWNVPENRLLTADDYSSTVIGKSNESVTGSFLPSDGNYRGFLRFWQPAGRAMTPVKQIALDSIDGAELLPNSMAWVGPDNIAVAGLALRRDASRNNQYMPVHAELRVLSRNQSQTASLVKRVKLWTPDTTTTRLLQIACSPDGQHIAVAGSPNDEVHLYRVADLLSDSPTPQRLGLDAKRFRSASFVSNGEGLGLLLVSSDEAEPTRTVVDFNDRRVSNDVTGWADASAPELKDDAIRVTATPESRQQLNLSTGSNGETVSVLLPKGHVYTAAAAVDLGGRVGDQHPTSIIAVAAQDRGHPLLQLYTEEGVPFRRLTGHSHRVIALSFSNDGKWLTSTGEGHTVCVWNLQEIDRVLGQHGSLHDAVITDLQRTPNGLKVLRADAQGILKPGDVVVGRIESTALKPWASADAFYKYVWEQRPGQPLTLRLQRGTQLSDVRMTIGQGMDETKPLFSMVILPQLDQRQSRWLAWSPLGPFDSSDRKIEELVGWHFNQTAELPSSFAPLKQYRDQYYRPHLIRDLIQNPMLIPPRRQPDPPSIGLAIPDSEADWTGEANRLIQQESGMVHVMIDPTFPADLVDEVRLRIGDQAPSTLQQQEDGTWGAKVSELNLSRGMNRLRASVLTRGDPLRAYSQDLVVRFQPAPPEIQTEVESVQNTKSADYEFLATVRPKFTGELVNAELIDRGTEKVLKTWQNATQISIQQQLSLRNGQNEFELIAHNANGAKHAEETTRFPFTVIRDAEASPPTIALNEISSTDIYTGLPVQQDWRPGKRIVVNSPEIQLRGQVTSTTDLRSLQLKHQGNSLSASGFEKDEYKSFVVRQSIALLPGKQTIQIIARSESKFPTTLEAELEYRPPLPTALPLPPKPGVQITEELDNSQVEFDIQLTDATDPMKKSIGPRDWNVRVIVNEEELADQPKIEIDETKGVARARVTLRPGVNSIRVKTENEWHCKSSEPLVLEYHPRPTVTKVTTLSGAKDPTDGFADLHIEGTSIDDITAVTFGGQPLVRNRDYELEKSGGNFSLNVKRLPRAELKRAAKALKLIAHSGTEVEMPELPAALKLQQNAVPVVEIAGPSLLSVADDDRYVVNYSIKSGRPVERIDVFHDQKVVQHERPARPARNSRGEYVYKHSVVTALQPALNLIQVVARSDAGDGADHVTINRVLRPVSIIIDGFSRRRTDPVVLKPSTETGSQITFGQPVPSGEVWLHGRIRWADATDKRISNNRFSVHVWVNGFQQLPTRLELSRDGKERRFQTQVVLGENDNLIEIGVPNLPFSIEHSRSFYVDCEQPVTNRRVHLLVFSVDGSPTDRGQLVDDAIRALNGKRIPSPQPTREVAGRRETPQIRFATPAFGNGIVYGPFTSGEIYRQKVMAEIHRVSRRIKLLTRSQPGTDVVVIYYQGAELVYSTDGFYLTTEPAVNPRVAAAIRNPSSLKYYAISSDLLNSHVEKNPGAHVLLLDVARLSARKDEHDWPNDSRAAMLRYAWLKNPQRMPPEASLLSGLKKVTPKMKKLNQVKQALETNQANVTRQFPDAVVFEEFVPPVLNGLTFGGENSGD